MKTHYTIPFFIPHEGCPHKCVFCDQRNITGQEAVKPGAVSAKIESYLATIPEGSRVEVGFFGGSFTGLAPRYQEELLSSVRPFLEDGRVLSIRLSTRPDMIDKETLRRLKDHGVSCIELGVQSMSDRVLDISKRGHTSLHTIEASRLITEGSFELGHQMMLGLPSSTFRDELHTAHMARELGATQVRIYPLVVIENTELAEWWRGKKYEPLPEEEALLRAAHILAYFSAGGIKVIRCGLHPSEELNDGGKCLAGPFHPAFRQKAESRVFAWMLERLKQDRPAELAGILFNPEDEGAFYGFGGCNRAMIDEIAAGRKGLFRGNEKVPRGRLLVARSKK